MDISVCVYMYIYVHACIYACMYVYMYVCLYIYDNHLKFHVKNGYCFKLQICLSIPSNYIKLDDFFG